MKPEPPSPAAPGSPPAPQDSSGSSELVIECFGNEFDPPPRILVADDDEMFGTFLARFFQREKCECHHVLEAGSARELLARNEYDMVVADIFMPGNTALEFIEQLPKIAEGIPVILLTGRPTVETAARSVRLAVHAYLTKPPDLAELRREARLAVAKSRNIRTIAMSRVRLKQWQDSMEDIESILRQASPGGGAAPWNRYLALTLQNLLLTLLELKQIAENVAVSETLGPTLRQAELLTAVQRTITVLRNTRQHFKSKDLGDLRQELEALISGGGPPTGGPAA